MTSSPTSKTATSTGHRCVCGEGLTTELVHPTLCLAVLPVHMGVAQRDRWMMSPPPPLPGLWSTT